MAMTIPARTPRLDGPLRTLTAEFDDMLGSLLQSLQGVDETQIMNEVDLLARLQQHRRAVLALQKMNAELPSTARPETI